MKSVTLGIIGCGKIAENHIKAAKLLGINISFLVDLNQARMLEISKQFDLGLIPMFTDYYDIFKHGINVDFVSIATASGNHYQIACDFIQHNFNVLIEKPITLSLIEANHLIELSKEHRSIVGAIHPNRYIGTYNYLLQAIENGELGKILYATLHVRLNRGEAYFNQAKWRGTWKQDGGGILMNQALHDVDILQSLIASPIQSIKASINNLNHPYIQAEDLALGLLEFQNGTHAIIEATSNIYQKNLEESLFVFGSKGTVKLAGKSLSQIEIWDTHLHPKEKQPHQFSILPSLDLTNLHIPVFQDFIEAINLNKKPKVSLSDALPSLEIILGMYQSALLNRTISAPINNLESKNFDGKFIW
jgi:UDP-N-acetyl-2-amino-2-deoxyglucuronate dehydrogenase